MFTMPKFLQSSAPKGGARVRNKADSIFGYILPEQDCMNYLSVCPAWIKSVAILTLNGDVPVLMFPVLFMGNERRFWLRSLRVVSQYWPHTYTPWIIACNTSRARNFFLFFTSLPPGSWEGSVVESIHQLSYLGLIGNSNLPSNMYLGNRTKT